MKRQRFGEGIVIVLLLIAACRREENVRPPVGDARLKPGATSVSATTSVAATTSYADAMQWLKSTRGFHFVLREGDTRAEGEMQRPTPGAEKVRLVIDGQEWLAATGKSGVVWTRGGVATDPPPNGIRMFQRVTLVFDPQKVEGEAQLVEPNHYRFTDANTRAVHDVWTTDGRIARMTIGDAMELTITP